MIRVTEPLNYFKEPWYVDWALKTFAARFKKCTDVEKARKFAMRDLRRICDEATDIGTEVDAIIKANCAGKYLPEKIKKVEVANCIEAYKKWYKVYQPVSVKAYDRINGVIEGIEVSGEPDLDVDGIIVDIKCSARISLGYWLQVMIYAYLLGRNKVAILRLDKETASYEYIVKDFDKNLVGVWVGLTNAVEYYKGDKDGGLGTEQDGEVKEVA